MKVTLLKVHNPTTLNPYTWLFWIIRKTMKTYWNHCAHRFQFEGLDIVGQWQFIPKWKSIGQWTCRDYSDWVKMNPKRIFEEHEFKTALDEKEILEFLIKTDTGCTYGLSKLLNYVSLKWFNRKLFRDKDNSFTCYETHGYFLTGEINNYCVII